jgi:hypothetical protein
MTSLGETGRPLPKDLKFISAIAATFFKDFDPHYCE